MTTVIKLGGSLLEAAVLPACLHAITRRDDAVVIVPGGGVFAEQVRIAQRCWGFDELAAHRMAILAMQQMALLINGLKPDFALFKLGHQPVATGISVWSPCYEQLDSAGIAASWEITSDSLAAWLAEQINAQQLILVKSAVVDPAARLDDLQQKGIIDAAFVQFARPAAYRITVLNYQHFLSAA